MICLLLLFGIRSLAIADETVFHSDLESAQVYNLTIHDLREKIQEKYKIAAQFSEEKNEETHLQLLTDIRALKQQIRSLEEKWRGGAIKEAGASDEAYALWDVGNNPLATHHGIWRSGIFICDSPRA